MTAAMEMIKRGMDYWAAEERQRESRTAKAMRRTVNKRLADDVPVARGDFA